MMTDDEMRVAIMEACGWDYDSQTEEMYFVQEGDIVGVPWPSLDAMHEAEKVLTDDWQQEKYLCKIQTVIDGGRTCCKVSESDHWQVARATASQRAEAFARVCFPERFNR